jgi:aspartate/methionine/tyrosine aminotransferase
MMRRALDEVIAALQRYRGEAIDLLVGEPCFEPPAAILSAFARTAGEPVSGYGPPAGLWQLRSVLAEWAGGPAVDPQQLVVTHGAKGGLLALLAALVEPGDEVIHPLPCYPAYPAMVRRFGGVPVGVAETGAGFAGWSRAVAEVLGDRTRAVVLSSPSNPSGSILTAGELESVVELCAVHGVRLILDEAYDAFRFDDGAVETVRDRPGETLVRVGSASKSLALCGWRMGWVVADAELATRVAVAQAALVNPPATPPQRALLALREVPGAYFEANRLEVRRRMEALAGAMRAAGFDAALPAGGFYLWIDVRDRLEGGSSAVWCERLAEEHGIGFWPGEDYGCPGFVRLALPQRDDWRDDVAELERRLR